MSTSHLPQAAAQEIQSLYEISRALLLTQDITDVLLTLRGVLAMDADAVLHVHVEEDHTARLRYTMQSMDEQAQDRILSEKYTYAPGDDLVQVLTSSTFDSSPAAPLIREMGGQTAVVLKLLDGMVLREVLLLIYHDARSFDDQTMRLYDAFVTQAAVIIQNQKLLTDVQANNDRLANQIRVLEALRALSDAVGSEDEDGPVMTLTMQSLVEITAADHAGVVIINSDGISATVAAEYPAQGVVGAQIEAKDNPVFTELLKGRKAPLLLENVETDPRISPRVRELLNSLGTKALIITPLVVGDELIGSVGLDLYTRGRQFTPDTLDLVATVTSQLSIFLQDVRVRRERERATEQVRLLDQVGTRFLALNRVDDLLVEAVRGLQSLLRTERIVIRLGDPSQREESGT